MVTTPPVLRSTPGLGPILAARVLAEIGDDPTRFTSANGLRAFAGTAPITLLSLRTAASMIGATNREQLTDRAYGQVRAGDFTQAATLAGNLLHEADRACEAITQVVVALR